MPSPRKSAAGTAHHDNAIELLKADHQEVDQLFAKFNNARGRSQRKKLIEQIATALTAHAIIEEEIFYPACRDHGVEEDNLEEAQVEHDTVKLLVRELVEGSLDDDYFDAKVTVLSEYVKHHVKEEEEPQQGIFARLQKTDADLDDLGEELAELKDNLMADKERLLARPPRVRSLQLGRGSGRPTASSHREPEPRQRGERAGGAGEGRGWHGDPRGHAEAARRGGRHRND